MKTIVTILLLLGLCSWCVVAQEVIDHDSLFLKKFIVKETLLNSRTLQVFDFSYLKIGAKKINSKKTRVDESITRIGIPFLNNFYWFFETYYEFENTYQDLKRIQDAYTSYEFINNDILIARIYLTNVGDLKNLDNYAALFKIKIIIY